MSVQFLDPAFVHALIARVAAARQSAAASETAADVDEIADDASYWEPHFEANAASVLGALERVRLAEGYAVRYRFYSRQGADLLVRPFVARAATDVSTVRQLLDWHAPPDSVAPALRGHPTRDTDLLYRHFTFEHSPQGYFEYWLAMQELWASARWIHSRVIADAETFGAVTGGNGWQIAHAVERCEPAVVADGERAQLAVLVFCPLERQVVTLHRIEIAADQSIEFADAIAVAHGPRGWLM